MIIYGIMSEQYDHFDEGDGYKVPNPVPNNIPVSDDTVNYIKKALEEARNTDEFAAALMIVLGNCVGENYNIDIFNMFFKLTKRWSGYNRKIKDIIEV